MVQTINRHGDRTPSKPIPADPAVWSCTQNLVSLSSEDGTSLNIATPKQLYRTLFIPNRESLLGNCTIGQLTYIGQQQTNSLGQYIRRVFGDDLGLISSVYNSNEIYVRSSETPRCLQSARNILDGLFPPQERINSLVIPIWVVEEGSDDMEISFRTCPAAAEATIANLIKPENLFQLLEPLVIHYEQLKTIFETSHPVIAALRYYDNCNCRVKHNMTLPNGMDMRIFNAIQKSYWFAGEVLFNSTAPLTIGPFVQELISFMDQKIAGQLSYVYQLFSGHDTTVGPILSLLGVYDGVWPPYASHIEFSLLQDTTGPPGGGAYVVQVAYDGNVMKLPACDNAVYCDYQKFKDTLLGEIPDSNECALLPGNRITGTRSIVDLLGEYFQQNMHLVEDLLP